MSRKTINSTTKFLRDWIFPIICAFLLAFLIRKFVFFKVRVPTGSMLPTVQLEDQIFVTKIYKPSQISRKDILVFERPNEKDYLLKRVIGMPGDNVDIKDNGDVYINGEKLDEPYVKYPEARSGVFNVPEGNYLMLGDNRANSSDSRDWENSYVPFSDIKGKTWIRVSPLDSFGPLK